MDVTGESYEKVIRRRLTPPELPEHMVRRVELDRVVTELIDRCRVMLVHASAGSGKTTAVVAAVQTLPRRMAWLSVDHPDVAAGRLVTYLEAALGTVEPGVLGVATDALRAGVSHVEAAGLLADALDDTEVTLVLDDLERLDAARPAWSVIEALVRLSPPSMRFVLVSRQEIPPEICAFPPGMRVGALDERSLAFSPDEAAAVLDALGARDVDPSDAVVSTGGWVTGLVYEAWRSDGHVAGSGGDSDPLWGYLSTHILQGMDEATREFVVATAVLEEVSVCYAEALGLIDVVVRMAAVRAAHLPGTWDEQGRVLRYHPRFREFLLDRLEQTESLDLRGLRLAHGRLLGAQGRHEDATDELLRAGALDEARSTAESAIFDVIERLDFEIADRWLAVLRPPGSTGSLTLATAELMAAVAQDDWRRAVGIADGLAAAGARTELAKESSTAAALMAWAYISMWRVEDVRAVLAVARPSAELDAARYAASLIGACAVPPPNGNLSGAGRTPFAFAMNYFAGELTEPSPAPSPWAEAVRRPYRIATLRALGDTERALAEYRAAREYGATVSLDAFLGPEVLIDAGRIEEAREALERGLELARESGSVGYQVLNRLTAAALLLRLEHDSVAAHGVLDSIEATFDVSRYPMAVQLLNMWRGLALLLQSDDREAADRLRTAVGHMANAHGAVELPRAAVYLAEAEWRVGDEDAADEAAKVALEAARGQGSSHVLLQALGDFPSVVTRALDTQPDADSPWHGLGRALRAQAGVRDSRVQNAVRFIDFGRPMILVDGVETPRLIAKSYELLAYLCTKPSARATRSELVLAMFEGNNSGRNYLRQAIHKLRAALPQDVGLVADEGEVRLLDPGVVASDSVWFDELARRAARRHGEPRMTACLEALALFDGGEYLATARSEWVDQRRGDLVARATALRHDAAETAYALGRLSDAVRLNADALRADRQHEAAWRLAMRIAGQYGDEFEVVRAYRECERALTEIGAAPSASTRRLLEALRR